MGASIKHSRFSEADYQTFQRRLEDNLHELAALLKQPGFGEGSPSLGAELELSLIGPDGKPRWINQEIYKLADDPLLTLELNQYNLEYNLAPLPAAGSPFTHIAQDITGKLSELNRLAAPLDARSVAIGILPTITRADISVSAMSDFERYRVLTESVKAMKDTPFEIDINGREPLAMELDNLNAEGANTSFQIHLRVTPDEFQDCYNAAQMASSLGLAVSTNSPLFLGHRLWEETRVPLFKQAVETRKKSEIRNHLTARTGLGSGWVKAGALELFQRSVDDFAVLLPECSDQHKKAKAGPPELFELRLHHGTVWHWNRAIYDAASGGHLRIEMRALPSGPSPIDMAANAAFLLGLTKALSHRMADIVETLDFNQVKSNFYRAAEAGLDAQILWPDDSGKPGAARACQLINQLIPLARQGLDELDVEAAEIEAMLDIIQQRVDRRITGARWQLQKLQRLEQKMDRADALPALLHSYLKHSDSGEPVHRWGL